jgi:uncharacterized protein
MKKILFAACLCIFITSLSAQELSAAKPSISVTGEAEVKVAPDLVLITLGLDTVNAQLSEVARLNETKVNRLFASLRQLGIDSKDIQTDFLHLQPVYEDRDPQLRKFLYYQQRTTIQITLRDVSKFDQLIPAVLKSGVEYIDDIEFRSTQLRQHRDQARQLAIAAAKEKAVALTGALNQKIGKPLSISEGGAGFWPSYGRWLGGSRYGSQRGSTQNVTQNLSSSSASSPSGALVPGTIAVRAEVSVVFAIE